MPRIVNFSDRNARNDKKPNEAPSRPGFFGARPSPPVVANRPVPTSDVPIAAPAGPTQIVENIIAAATEEVVSVEATAPTSGAATDAYLLSEQIIAKSVPEEVVSKEGAVDFERLFQAARIPSVAVNAEHAIHILESLPSDLPLRVKHLAVRTSLNVMSDLVQESSVAPIIVNDAAQKMLWIARLQENLTTEIDARRASTRSEIAMLEAQIAAKSAMLAEAEGRSTTALKTCRQRTSQLNEVMEFFDRYESGSGGSASASVPVESAASQEDEELPPHLRDDSVFRLLGLHETASEDAIVEVSVPIGKIGSDSRNGARRY